jgi:hypothetical protein
MRSRSARAALLALALAPSCRAIVDSGITYAECSQTDYTEPFEKGSTLKQMLEHCWETSDATTDEGDPSADILLEDGDLVIRSSASFSDASQWQGETQGPLAYQRLEADFVLATRVEAFDKINADRCVPPGYRAGLALRLVDSPADWVTFMIESFEPTPPAICDESGETHLPTLGRVESNGLGNSKTTTGQDDAGIGLDDAVEADIAICRVGDAVSFYYREPGTDAAPVWRQVGGGDFVYDISGPLDVGLTVAGVKVEGDPAASFRTGELRSTVGNWKAASFRTGAHFQWAFVTDTILTDGCEQTLAAFQFPTVE